MVEPRSERVVSRTEHRAPPLLAILTHEYSDARRDRTSPRCGDFTAAAGEVVKAPAHGGRIGVNRALLRDFDGSEVDFRSMVGMSGQSHGPILLPNIIRSKGRFQQNTLSGVSETKAGPSPICIDSSEVTHT
jgi:hypothetical protein